FCDEDSPSHEDPSVYSERQRGILSRAAPGDPSLSARDKFFDPGGMILPRMEFAEARSPTAAERLALRIVQAGAIAVVILSSTLTMFDLDRFFVPKELALHVTAVAAG